MIKMFLLSKSNPEKQSMSATEKIRENLTENKMWRNSFAPNDGYYPSKEWNERIVIRSKIILILKIWYQFGINKLG